MARIRKDGRLDQRQKGAKETQLFIDIFMLLPKPVQIIVVCAFIIFFIYLLGI
tara:strand:+ start:94 stop:252 length:159 start_codon:yes stop_codon:yes gene_type:complete